MKNHQSLSGIRFQIERETPSHFFPLGLVAGLFLLARGTAIGSHGSAELMAAITAHSIDDLLHSTSLTVR